MTTQYRSFFTTLQQYTRQKDFNRGRALHAQIIKADSFTDTYIANSLVNFYAKCGELLQAKFIFDRIPNRDVVSWNCLINAFSRKGPSFVMQLFRLMRAENTCPNAHTFAGVFTAASNLPDAFVGRQAHALALKTDCFDDVFVGSSLLNVYCKSGCIEDGRKVFDRMHERNSISWATMISGCAMQQLASEAFLLFENLRRDGEDENEFVITSVLSALTVPELADSGKQVHCHVIKNSLLSFVSVQNALVTMYAKCGNLDEALRTFESSDDKNSITWSAIITGCAQSGDSRTALKLFSHMHSSCFNPSEFTLVGVINACSDIFSLEVGKQVHCFSVKSGFESQIYIMTALVDMYAKCGSISDARKGFDDLQEADIVMWTSMIGGYVQNGKNEDALSLYCRMQIEGIIPNELTMASVLKACSGLAALDQGKQIHTCLVKYGFSLEVPVGSALSTMYAKCGCLEDGNLVFWRMPARDVVSWNAMISGLSQNGYGHEALELFEKMRQEGAKPDSVTFVNVLSACSHMGLVNKGWGYFNMMFDEFCITPSVEHYACMVDVLSRAGQLNEAKELIELAAVENAICLWRILLGACRNYRNYELGAYAGEKLMELGSQESSAYVLLSSIYASLGQSDDIERVMRTMKIRGVSKEPGCSWIELKSQVHVFVINDQMHPQIREIRSEIRRLSKQMKSEGNTFWMNCKKRLE